MQKIDYIVTFTGDYPCGERHPLIIKVTATGVANAISMATDAIEDDRIEATNLVLLSVIPESHPLSTDDANRDGQLGACPFCGNTNVSLVESLLETDSENLYFVNCGCCNATQLPDSKKVQFRTGTSATKEQSNDVPY